MRPYLDMNLLSNAFGELSDYNKIIKDNCGLWRETCELRAIMNKPL